MVHGRQADQARGERCDLLHRDGAPRDDAFGRRPAESEFDHRPGGVAGSNVGPRDLGPAFVVHRAIDRMLGLGGRLGPVTEEPGDERPPIVGHPPALVVLPPDQHDGTDPGDHPFRDLTEGPKAIGLASLN